jgi:signal transduction histidine kinase
MGEGRSKRFSFQYEATGNRSLNDIEVIHAEFRKLSTDRDDLVEAVNASPAALAIFDQDARLEICNRAFADDHATAFQKFDSLEDAEGLSYEKIGILNFPANLSDAEETAYWAAHRVLDPNELCNWTDVEDPVNGWRRIAKFATPSGKVALLSYDISDIKSAQALEAQRSDDAIRSRKATTELLSRLSHEIRTPLNGIMGLAALLENSETDKQKHEWLSAVKSCGDSILEIIEDILDMAQMEREDVGNRCDLIDVNRLAGDVLDPIRAQAMSKGLDLLYKCDPEKFTFLGDQRRIRQTLINLLGNAVKFTDEGEIRLTISRSRTKVRFVVEDSGPGVPNEMKPIIFEQYVQARSKSEKDQLGLGLGLAIARDLVSRMDGRMEVGDSDLGGARFWFELPLLPALS